MSTIPRLVVSNKGGEIFDCPEFAMLGIAGETSELPKHFVPLPEGSSLFTLPGRVPIGFDENKKKIVELPKYFGEEIQAVAAFVAPAYTQLLRPVFKSKKNAPVLPLYCYTAIGWKDDKFWVPAVRIDSSQRQDCNQFDEEKVKSGAQNLLKKYPENRLVQHLMNNCCLRYSCPAARNFALGRWEMPLPTSRACNSHCLGCISFQSGDHICAAQERITFRPSAQEISEIVIPHFENAEFPIASFGQGCEGEPLTEITVLEKSISLIRNSSKKGTINLNTNASYPDRIEKLISVGLDSIRISLNSARKEFYNKYFRPSDYSFDDVKKSIKIARKNGVWVSLNYFVFPGFTDQKAEYEALRELLKEFEINMIQWRNLNIDPEWYVKNMGIDLSAPRIGIFELITKIKDEFPEVKFGYFNPFLN